MRCLILISILFLVCTVEASTRRGMLLSKKVVSAGGGGGGWSSNNMTGWFVVEDLSGVANNGTIAVLTNRIGANENFATGDGTVIKSNAVFNSKAAAYFNGSSSLTTASVNWNEFVAAEACTIYVVLRQRGASQFNNLIKWQDGSGDMVFVWATYDNTFYLDYPNSGGSGRISGAQPGGWDDAVHVLTLNRGANTADIRVDGVSAASGTPSDNLTSAGAIGWFIGAASNGFDGDIAEIRIFNVSHNSTEMDANEDDLKATYGTP